MVTNYRIYKKGYYFQFLIQCFSGYTKAEERYCTSPYGSFSSLISAQVACLSDVNCEGVQDYLCDNSGTFSLCPKSARHYSQSNYCVYNKGKRNCKQKYTSDYVQKAQICYKS